MEELTILNNKNIQIQNKYFYFSVIFVYTDIMKYLIQLFDITQRHNDDEFQRIVDYYGSNALDIRNIRNDFNSARSYVSSTRKQ